MICQDELQMRVVVLTETFSKDMGYLPTCLPPALARSGVDVHVVTMDLPPYYNISDFDKTYGSFTADDDLIPNTVQLCDGYTLHVLPHKRELGYMRMVGMVDKLKSIRPDVVQTMVAIGWLPLDAFIGKFLAGYKLFTGNHTTASVFPLAAKHVPLWKKERMRNTFMRFIPGRVVSLATEKCYGATADCADIAWRFFGVQRNKVDICPLGVDTGIFRPSVTAADNSERASLREKLGFGDSEIVCIYTGRFSDDKNPLLLARAIELLTAAGEPYRGLFVGDGTQAEAIKACGGCTVHPFVPFRQLGRFFRAADIGVWPTQESMSMMDAAACGIPIIVNDTIIATERVEGNGLTYRLGDVDDLVRSLLSLRDSESRMALGSCGTRKMTTQFSWDMIAHHRLDGYTAALGDGAAVDREAR